MDITIRGCKFGVIYIYQVLKRYCNLDSSFGDLPGALSPLKFSIKLWNGSFQSFIAQSSIYYHVHSLYSRCGMVIITFDLYDKESLDDVQRYIDEITHYTSRPTPIFIVGINPAISNRDGTEIVDYSPMFKNNYHYYNFDLYNATEQTLYDFDKYLINSIELMINSKIKVTDHLLKEPVKKIQGTILPNLTIDQYLSVSPPKKTFKDQQERDYYESLFFKVFRDKMLLKYIFESVSWLHRQVRIRAFSFYNSPINHLIINNKLNYLKEKQMIQHNNSNNSNISDNRNIYFREILKEEFSYINVVYLLRSSQLDFEFFKFVYDKYRHHFVPFHNPSEVVGFEELATPFENAIIGGNMEIVLFLYNELLDKENLSRVSFEYAVSFGHLPIVKFLKEHEAEAFQEKRYLVESIKLSKKFNHPHVTKYLEKQLSKIETGVFKKLFNKLK